MSELNAVLAMLGVTPRDLIEDLIGAAFFADFGVVQATDQTTVDVRHAIKPVVAGVQQGETVTKWVEVLWPASGGLSEKGKISVGDAVLLIGLRDFVKTVASGIPGTTDVPLHYTQETMKAILLGAYNAGATHTIDASAAVMKIDGGGKKAARQDDDVIIDATTAPAFLTYLGTLTPPWGGGAIHGKINAGSGKVEIG